MATPTGPQRTPEPRGPATAPDPRAERAADLRAGGAEQALDRIRAALADPAAGAAHLAAVFNDAGARDAAVAMTAAGGPGGADRWERLAAAARAAGRHALADGGHSTHGPLAVLALTRWAAGDPQGAARMCAAVPVQDAAHRFASLIAVASRSSDFARFAAAAAGFDQAETLAFRRRPTPPAPPAAAAADWFADPLPGTADGPAAAAREELLLRQGREMALLRQGQEMAARGWSMHVTAQMDLGDGIAWTGVLRRRGAAEALVTQDGRGGAPLVRFTDRAAGRRWRDDLAATGVDEETAITGLDILDAGLPPAPQQDGRTAAVPPDRRRSAAAPPADHRFAGPGEAGRNSTARPAAAAPPRPRTVRGPAR